VGQEEGRLFPNLGDQLIEIIRGGYTGEGLNALVRNDIVE
jgi:hypothetical protein